MLALALSLAFASDDPARVDPDRPNVANSTATVPAGAVQLEAGADVRVHGKTRADSFRVAAPLTVRIGVHDRAELRLFDGDPYRWSQGTLGARQQGEISLGAKVKLWERERGTKVSIGLQPQLLPVAPHTNAIFWAPLPALVLLHSVEPGDWHLDLNLGFKTKVTRHGRCCDVEGLLAASLARSLAEERVCLWAETYARLSLAEHQLSEISGDAGIMVRPTRRLGIDVAAIVGQAGGEFEVAVTGGLSVRIGPRRRRAT